MEQGFEFPENLERLLLERALGGEPTAAAKHGFLGGREVQEVAAGLFELSGRFTGDEAAPLGPYMESGRDRAAYFLYYLPANFVKAKAVLSELDPLLPERDRWNVLDVGSGPGSLSLGALDFLARRRGVRSFYFRAEDSTREALADYEYFIAGYGRELLREGIQVRLEAESRVVDVETPPRGEQMWDLVLFGDSINELFRSREDAAGRRARLLAAYAEALSEGGKLVVVEPALKRLTLSLQTVRDLLAGEYALHIHAPCLRQSPCPMLASGRGDWCHAAALWKRPSSVRRIDEAANRKRIFIKFAYLAAGNEPGCPVAAPEGLEAFRAVGNLRREKGKYRALLCGREVYDMFALLRRSLSVSNEAFTDVSRGDLLGVSGWHERGDGMRLTEESRVETLRKLFPR